MERLHDFTILQEDCIHRRKFIDILSELHPVWEGQSRSVREIKQQIELDKVEKWLIQSASYQVAMKVREMDKQ